MKDIDFDELDRAVSSVLGQQSPKQDDTDTNAVQTVAPQEPTASAESSSAEAVAPVEVSSEQAPASTTPLAVKRRGKFMDVMHPSADMSSSTAQATSTRPTRTSPVLQPLSSDVAPEMPAQDTPVAPAETEVIEPTAELDESHALIGAEPAPVENLLPEHAGEDDVSHDAAAVSEKETSGVETSAVESEAPVETTVDTEDKSETDDVEPVKSLYVDPLELAGSDEQPKEEAAQTPAVVAQAQPTDEPQSTPFIADAQVDKRPLGAFGEAENAAANDAAGTETTPAEVPVDTQESPAVPLPRELQSDVVEVESASAQEAEASPVPVTADTKAGGVDDGRVEGHPLFDTSTYHEPIAAVHSKGMPGWVKWLIGLLLCLALGAGVGYFLFTAGL